jgi:hypothetical protein
MIATSAILNNTFASGWNYLKNKIKIDINELDF